MSGRASLIDKKSLDRRPHPALLRSPAFHRPEIAIVIPVYNHPRTLREVVIKALKVHRAVMVVDDGSSDSGLDTLDGLTVNVVRHPRNLGKGVAILSGAREWRRLGMTHIVTIDADGQHDPDDFRRFVTELDLHPDAIVVGKRDFEVAEVPSASRIGRAISNFWLRVETGKVLGDAQSGFRAYPIALLEGLKLHERRYSFEIEVLVKAAWAGVELREVPVSTYYPPAEERVSHYHLFWDNVRLSLLNTKLSLRSVAHCRTRRRKYKR